MIQMSDNIGDLAAALAQVQSKLTGAVKDSKNPHLNTKFADLGSAWDACRAPLAESGLAVVQVGVRYEDGKPGLCTLLIHKSGQFIGGDIPLNVGEPKGITAMQAVGSAVTYARRYGLMAAVGIIAEDDDGHGAGSPQGKADAGAKNGNGTKTGNGAPANGGTNSNAANANKPPLVTPPQVKEIQALCVQKGKGVDKVLKRFKVDALGKLTLSQYGIIKSGFAQLPDAQRNGNESQPDEAEV